MTNLSIHIIPDAVLRQVAEPVSKVDKNVAHFMDAMLATMYQADGIGLAANQVGDLRRIILADTSPERNGSHALLMANPEIIWQSEEKFTYKEGCLSIPGQYANVTRAKKIGLRYLDQANKSQEIEAEDLLSICLQHEIDHLNGILFIDYLSSLKRNMIIRKVEKHQRENNSTVL